MAHPIDISASLPLLQAVLDQLTEGVALLDRDWQVIYANAAAQHMIQAAQNARGASVASGPDPTFRRAYQQALDEARSVTVEGYYAPLDAWFEAQAVPFGVGVMVTFRDISERQHIAAERAEALAATSLAHNRLRVLSAISDLALAARDLDQFLPQALAAVRACMQVDNGAILLLDDQGILHVRAAHGLEEEVAASVRVPLGKGFAGRIASNNRYLIVDDLRTFDVVSPFLREKLVSAMGAPLRVGEQVIGVLHVGTAYAHHFTEADAQLLQLVADRVALAIAQVESREREHHVLASARENEAKFRATFENAAIGLARVSLDGAWIEVNQTLCAIVGYTRDELLTKTFQDITYPADLDADLDLLKQLLQGEIPNYDLEKRYLRKDGRLVWINLTVALARQPDGSPDYFISAVEDISARKATEAELRASEARQQTLIATLPQLIWTLNTAGEITFINERWLAFAGLPRATLLGQGLLAVVHPDDRARLLQQRRRALKGSGDFETEGRYRRHDGVYRWHTIRISPLRDGQGKTLGWYGAATDIDDLKRAEAKLRALNASLEERVASRTAELEAANRDLDAFSYTAAHDLRAPLRGMQGFAQALLEDYGAQFDATARRYAQRIAAAAERMDRLIQDLLEYGRLGRADVRLTRVSLALVVRAAHEQLAAVIQAKGAQVHVTGPLPEVTGNVAVLTQVIANLLSNALTYIAPDAIPDIRVWAEARDDGGTAWARLWVADNGIGIAPDYAARIFLPFERLHGQESYPGTGIGLAIVRRGMERLGGRVGMTSLPGQGSQFWLDIPLAEV